MTQVDIENASNSGSFMKKHWKIIPVFTAAVIALVVGAVYVFSWFTSNAQSTGLVPSTLGLWTMGNLVAYILHLIFYELVFIGIPAVVGAVIGWQWWKRLPEQEKYHTGKSSRSSRAGGAVSPLLFIAFALKVYADGNWKVAISTYTLNYVVGSMITILEWIAAIAAIPAAIGIIWWIHHEMNKP